MAIVEVFKSILRQKGEDWALEAIAHMQQGRVIALDSEIAIDAACFGVEFKLPLADSIIYATAKKYDATIWTQDAGFEGLPGVQYIAKR